LLNPGYDDPSVVKWGSPPRHSDGVFATHSRPRIVDRELKARLKSMGAVVIEGPKACGKTATARQNAKSEVLLDVDRNARQAAGLDPTLVLDGPTPRLLDEWQIVPEIWNHIRRAVDDRGNPGHLKLEPSQALDAVRAYLDEIRRVDVTRVNGVERDPTRVSRLLSSLARNVGTYAGVTTLAADTGGDDGPLARTTVMEYMSALERLMILEDQPPWAPHLRSRSRLRKAPKRHFVDPSLAVAALGATPENLLEDLEFFGFASESLVVRDLRVYAQAMDPQVLQYGDHTGLEVDAVVQARDGRWAAFEVKLGQNRVDEAAKNLLDFRGKVDAERSGEAGALAVIVGSGYSYMREDGVAVVSIGTLGP